MVWASVGIVSGLAILLFYLTIKFYFSYPYQQARKARVETNKSKALHCIDSITQISQNCRLTKLKPYEADSKNERLSQSCFVNINERNGFKFPDKEKCFHKNIQTGHISESENYSYGGYKQIISRLFWAIADSTMYIHLAYSACHWNLSNFKCIYLSK